MTQKSFYALESFDLAQTTITYTSAGPASARYTAGVTYYTRLDIINGANGPKNNFISVLWSKGSGTAPTAYLGLYTTDATKLYLIASVSIGALATGLIRQQLVFNAAETWQVGELYVGLLVATDAGTLHVDCATSTPFVTNGVNADPTGNGGLPRACFGAGTALTALPSTEVLSGVTASGLLMYAALD